MFQKLQIVFCILAAIAVACVLPLGGLLGWTYGIVAALFALLFFGVMMLCKQQHSFTHPEQAPPETKSESESQDGQEKKK